MYKSIPPRPVNFTFTDMLMQHSRFTPFPHRSKTAPLSTSLTEEYIQRFHSKPKSHPNIIQFADVKRHLAATTPRHRGMSGYYPSTRVRTYCGSTRRKPREEQVWFWIINESYIISLRDIWQNKILFITSCNAILCLPKPETELKD